MKILCTKKLLLFACFCFVSRFLLVLRFFYAAKFLLKKINWWKIVLITSFTYY